MKTFILIFTGITISFTCYPKSNQSNLNDLSYWFGNIDIDNIPSDIPKRISRDQEVSIKSLLLAKESGEDSGLEYCFSKRKFMQSTGYIELTIGDLLSIQMDTIKAQNWYRKSSALGCPFGKLRMAAHYLYAQKDTSRAKSIADNLLNSYGYFTALLAFEMELLDPSKKPEEIMKIGKRIPDDYLDATVYYQQGWALIYQYKYNDAEPFLYKSNKCNENEWVYYALANIELEQDNCNRAIELLSKSVEMDSSSYFLSELGWFNLHCNDVPSAEQVFEENLTINKKPSSYLEIIIFYLKIANEDKAGFWLSEFRKDFGISYKTEGLALILEKRVDPESISEYSTNFGYSATIWLGNLIARLRV